MNSNKVTKKLMLEFFESMIQENFPGEGLRVGHVGYMMGKGESRDWQVQVFFRDQKLTFDPFAWVKIRQIIFRESFQVAMGKVTRVEVTVSINSSYKLFSQVSGWIRFEEKELLNLWLSLSEGKNPYG